MKFLAVLLILLAVGIASAAVDDGYTTLLVHFDNDSFIEESGQISYPFNGLIWTATPKVFGAGSGYFSTPEGGNVLYFNDAPGNVWDIGDGEATVDVRVYFTSLPTDGVTRTPIYFQQDTTGPWNLLAVEGDNRIIWESYYGGATKDFYNGTLSTPITLNEWHHIAVVRNGTTDFKGYFDGVNVANTRPGGRWEAFRYIISGDFRIGQMYVGGISNAMAGYMDEFRFSNGIRRWTTDFTPPTMDYRTRTWSYSTPGTYTWVCPEDVTEIFINMGAGGGGGKGGEGAGINTHYAGGSGGYGEWQNLSSFEVVPGQSYTIVVGDHGVGSPYGWTLPTAGGDTLAFGEQMHGGIAGVRIDWTGDGNATQLEGTSLLPSAGHLAVDGGDGAKYGGGGTWYGAHTINGYSVGGGGAAVDYNGVSAGGDGSTGYVGITIMEVSTCNQANFYADSTNVSAGDLVRFTDTSTIRETANMSYLWDFGDGYTSSTEGTLNHVYAWNGIFTVNLTITSDSCADLESKPEYITVSRANDASGLTVSPKYVDFIVKTFWGASIPNATVVVTPVSTSTGSFAWLTAMLGVPSGEFNPNTSVMTQTTDMQGRTSFYVLPTAKYNVNITAPGYTIQGGDMVPSDTQYTFRSDLLMTEVYTNGYNELEVITFTTNGTELNTTHGRIHTEYTDSLAQTTSVVININQSTSIGNLTTEETIATYTQSGSGNFTYDFDLEGTRDNSYLVRMESTGTTLGTVNRDYGVTFPPGPVSFGIPEDLLVYVGMIGLFFIAFCFTRTLPGPAVITIMFFAWIFYLLGWWRDLADPLIVIAALVFFSAIAIFFNIMLRSKKSYAE